MLSLVMLQALIGGMMPWVNLKSVTSLGRRLLFLMLVSLMSYISFSLFMLSLQLSCMSLVVSLMALVLVLVLLRGACRQCSNSSFVARPPRNVVLHTALHCNHNKQYILKKPQWISAFIQHLLFFNGSAAILPSSESSLKHF
jgi:hypothetical protein